MIYTSTRNSSARFSLTEALGIGLAPDGGLIVPEAFPAPMGDSFAGGETLQDVAVRLLAPFFRGDSLAPEIEAICRSALNFPIPLKPLSAGTAVLELLHGPTAAFKDVGARFLAECLTRIVAADRQRVTLLVATSGDTGGAVAAAFHGKPGIDVAVLFPKGMVSPRQEKQLTCWGDNVRAFAVEGNFDDCQRLVKAAMLDPALNSRRRLSSANSINIGRLLPQMTYYAWAALDYRRRRGTEPGFIVPSGNLGNATAALWARRMGFPVREVVLATNANRGVPGFLAGEPWQPHPTLATLATAMDVGWANNMERVMDLLGGETQTRRALQAFSVADDDIRRTIASGEADWGEVWDPHTATAVKVRQDLGTPDWIVVATAHPAKFETVVEPLIGRTLPVPPALRDILSQSSHVTPLAPELDALKAAFDSWDGQHG